MSTTQLRESLMFEFVEPNVANFYIRVTKDVDGKYPHVGVQAYNLTTPEMAFTPETFSSLLQWLIGVHQRVVALNTPAPKVQEHWEDPAPAFEPPMVPGPF